MSDMLLNTGSLTISVLSRKRFFSSLNLSSLKNDSDIYTALTQSYGASKLIFGPSTTNTPCFFRSFALLKRACTFFMLLFDALVIIFFSFYIDVNNPTDSDFHDQHSAFSECINAPAPAHARNYLHLMCRIQGHS